MNDNKTEKKIDGRVRRTKKLLKEGLTELITEKSIKKITVRELSDLVEINRGTFYLHYNDIYDLVEQIENELFEEFEAIIFNYSAKDISNDAYSIFSDACHFLEDNRKICSALLGDNGDINFVMKLRKVISDKCFNDFSHLYDVKSYQDVYGYIYSYFESGAVGIIRYWLNDNTIDRKSPEEIARMLETLFTKGASGFSESI